MAELKNLPFGLTAQGGETLRVTLVNNMADSGLAITEQRFHRLLQAACPKMRIDLRCVTLPAIPRGEMADARIARHYITLDELHAAPPDALIFSGAEPARTSLRDEIFWPGLTDLFDWSKAEQIPTLFSCLAAHAAILHFSGIERRRLAQKTFGVFAQTATSNHIWLRGMPRRYSVAHSRWNDVDAKDLVDGGYQVLAHGRHTGADIFVPADGAPMLFLQGHPEYEETALLGEYKRDLRRFEGGESQYKPTPPLQEDWGSSACPPKPPVNSLGVFKAVIGNWIQRKREMVI